MKLLLPIPIEKSLVEFSDLSVQPSRRGELRCVLRIQVRQASIAR